MNGNVKLAKFEKDMAAFSEKQHHETQNYIHYLKACGWTFEDAVEWLRVKREKAKIEKAEAEIYKKICEECTSVMYLQPVNNSPQTQTGDSADTFVWICPNKNCMHTIFIQDTLEQIKTRGK